MKRAMLAVLVAVGCSAGPARAETLPLIEGVPATYTPGQDFTFTVRVPALTGFSAYSLELVFGTDATNPPLVAFPTVAPVGQYVFPTNANFAFQFDAPADAPEVRLTLSDSSAPVSTTPGANDTIATVTVRPGADLTGPITISVGADSGFDYNSEQGEFPFPEPIVVQQAQPTGGGDGNPVPAPPGVLLAGLGAAVLGFRSRFGRRAA